MNKNVGRKKPAKKPVRGKPKSAAMAKAKAKAMSPKQQR